MKTLTCLSLMTLAVLAGCKQQEPAAPRTEAQVKAEAAKIDRPQPGRYRVTMTVDSIAIPGMAAEQAARLKEMFSKTGQTREFCLTPAEAEKGYEEINKRIAQGKCNYDRFAATAGTLDAAMTCQAGQGMTGTYAMKGSFTPTGSQLDVTVKQSAPGLPGAGMTMQAKVANTRIGDC